MHAWKQLRGEITSASGHNFERLVLPLLRLFWPDMVRPPERDILDRAGIDLASGLSGVALACVVQCKGFYAHEELTRDQYRQIRASIDGFIDSPFRCSDYVLLHNRDSRDVELKHEIEADLQRIVSGGKALRARLWDRQTFLRDLRLRLRDQLTLRMIAQSEAMLAHMGELFHFGDIYLPSVPVSEQRLLLRRGALPEFEEVETTMLREPAKLISSPAEDRWTLLIGLFGTGKTSAALHAARSEASRNQRTVIYARCGDMRHRDGGVGTNLLMETVLASLALFEDFEADARAQLLRLSGTLLRAMLVDDANDALLILDGLDENPTYATPRGMLTLSSTISELRCPILLTTREEHFAATFANYEDVLVDHSLKGGARTARVFRLEAWSDSQICGFLDLVIARSETPAISAVELRRAVACGTVPSSRLELLRHPLFLQMTAELVVADEDWGENAAELLGKWTTFKMWRDLQVDRVLPDEVHDKFDYVSAMGRAMEQIASAMVERHNDGLTLTETIAAEQAILATSRAFPLRRQDLLTATSGSLLVALPPRPNAERRVKFSHRAFQEYYLARHILHENLDIESYPDEVRALHAELAASPIFRQPG